MITAQWNACICVSLVVSMGTTRRFHKQMLKTMDGQREKVWYAFYLSKQLHRVTMTKTRVVPSENVYRQMYDSQVKCYCCHLIDSFVFLTYCCISYFLKHMHFQCVRIGSVFFGSLWLPSKADGRCGRLSAKRRCCGVWNTANEWQRQFQHTVWCSRYGHRLD